MIVVKIQRNAEDKDKPYSGKISAIYNQVIGPSPKQKPNINRFIAKTEYYGLRS